MLAETNKNVKNDNNEKEDSFSSLIQILKETADQIDIAYNPTYELGYVDKLLNENDFTSFCKKQNKTPTDMAVAIMKMSTSMKYRKGPCS